MINDLFADIFYPDNISNSLYYVIEKLFESEINKLENISDFQKVLVDSNIGYLLGGLLLKDDIQSYFSLILTDIIEGYENSEESYKPLIFKVKDIEDYLLKEEEKYSKQLRRVDTDNAKKEIIRRKNRENYLFNQLYKMNLPKDSDCISLCSCLTLSKSEEIILKNKKETELFVVNYIVDLNKIDLLDKINKEKNNYVKIYLQKKLKILDKESDIFNNKILLGNIQKLKNSEKILFFYQKSFINSINLIQKVLNKINSSLDAIPNSIKYISKIISDLLIKKFKKADTIDIFNQLAYFYFMKLFKYIFLSPECYPLINNVILSEGTKNNLIKIFEILSKFVSGEFYKSNEDYSSNYTPFNWYFIENINIIYNLCQKLTSTNAPWSKKSTLNNNKNNFYSYSICFNMEIFDTIISIIDKKRIIIFKNNKHQKFKILMDDKIIKNKEINKQIKTEVDYFLYFQIKFSDLYKDIEQASLTEKIFQVSEGINSFNKKKKSSNNLEIENFDFIEAKKILYEILLSINDNDINEMKHKLKNNSTKEILKIMKNYYKSKTFAQKDINTKINNNYNQKNIPIEWHIDSLLNHLDKLNEYNIKNDYNNFYSSFSKDINNSLKKYNFKALSEIIEKSKYIKYYIKYFKNCQKKYVELIVNTKIKKFIEREKINVIIKLTYNLNEKILNIYSSENNKDINGLDSNNKIELCKYMNDFINNFPNLSKIDKSIEPELFEVEDKINLKGALNDFINILKVKMFKYFQEKEKEMAIYKIKKYILTKIYEKIYPQDYDKDDLLFYYKAISLSWIEPKHLKIPYEINIDNFLPITNSYFKQIDYEKSPSCKMDIITKIFNTISSALKFCQGGNFSTDDIAPLFEYALIKARPQRLSSNLRYLEFFISKGSELKNMYFDFLKNNMNSIKNISFNQFDGITEEEFKQRCEEANKTYIN